MSPTWGGSEDEPSRGYLSSPCHRDLRLAPEELRVCRHQLLAAVSPHGFGSAEQRLFGKTVQKLWSVHQLLESACEVCRIASPEIQRSFARRDAAFRQVGH